LVLVLYRVEAIFCEVIGVVGEGVGEGEGEGEGEGDARRQAGLPFSALLAQPKAIGAARLRIKATTLQPAMALVRE